MKFRSLTALAAAGAIVLSACGDDGNDTADEQLAEETAAAEAGDIVEVASTTEGFSTLVAAVSAAGLVEALQGEGPFTVFAPTDDAFAALPEGVLDALLLEENQDALVKILTYHVVADEVTSDEIEPGPVPTVEGQSVELDTSDGVTVNGANVIIPDVPASNGVIHAIDAVLLPPDVDPAALVGHDDDMTDESMSDDAMSEELDVVETAVAAEDFDILVAAVEAAGLVETLQGEGPFTVFAPTDAAFEALPDGVLDALLLEENQDVLVEILTYHVLADEVTSDEIVPGEVETVQGDTVVIDNAGGVVTVNDAEVIAADVMASNGVIHVIDAVILPPDIDPAAL